MGIGILKQLRKLLLTLHIKKKDTDIPFKMYTFHTQQICDIS